MLPRLLWLALSRIVQSSAFTSTPEELFAMPSGYGKFSEKQDYLVLKGEYHQKCVQVKPSGI
jgi:hypothetical protein